MAEFLLNNGAMIDLVNKFGESALHKACGSRSLPLLDLLLKKQAE